jgi:hypothetical protein
MSWQALRCVLEHLSFRTDDQRQRVATGNDQLVLIRLADRAHEDGGGIIVGRRRLAKDAGLSDRTVKDALGRLFKAGVLEREAGRGPRNVYRHRIPLCELCRAHRSSGYSGDEPQHRSSGYSGGNSDRSNSRMPTGVVATPKPYRTPPGPRELARLQAANRPERDNSSNVGRGGGLAPSPAPPAVGRSADRSPSPSAHATTPRDGATPARPSDARPRIGRCRAPFRPPPPWLQGRHLMRPCPSQRRDEGG